MNQPLFLSASRRQPGKRPVPLAKSMFLLQKNFLASWDVDLDNRSIDLRNSAECGTLISYRPAASSRS
jgi:hypothetical protein